MDPFALAAARREVKAAPIDPGGTALSFLPSGVGMGQPLYRSWEADLSSKAYRRNSVGYAALDRVWKGGSSVPWIEKRRAKPGEEWEVVPGGEYETLLENPNPKQSRQVFIGMGIMHLFRHGNMLAQMTPEVGKTRELWLLNPGVVKPIPDEMQGGWTGWYEMPDRRSWGGKKRIPAERVVHAMFPDPDNPLWGMSPYEVISDIVEMDRDQVEWQRSQVNKEPGVRGFFSAPDARTTEQVQQAKARVMAVLGGKNRAGEPLVVGGSTSYNHFDRTTLELDWSETRKGTAAEIAWTIGHLPAMFSTSAMTYDNLTVAVTYMWENIIIPTLSLIEGALNLMLVPREQRSRLWLTVDLSGVPALIEQMARRLAALQGALQSGVPYNQAVSALDLPFTEQPGGDVSLVNAGLQPLASAGAGFDADLMGAANEP